MFLTPDELLELTDFKTSRKQLEWLRANGYPFAIGGHGRPKVLRDVMLARCGSQAATQRPRVRLP
ncbi:hypothetical protein BI364_13715 [Acidihalobacter yilgarnensis]|uniref:DUF4224 domain-containing protein n=1 Tax=Acidihalobacter yilgarnensis TaxID=2819280 RepID=A0A1D8IR47_9GAMM|nr:DUF4224 domain-containing protein [Acidihalobacter yilgarnensis]AOU98875.1 hypothetical protein BI364_13715 [Acidihalobacter yilgarnensis]